MQPKPSLCLNIPKTGSSWMRHFFDAADWLERKRRCGLGHRTVPLRASLELAMRELGRSALFAQILEEKAVYAKHLLPLAGATRCTEPCR